MGTRQIVGGNPEVKHVWLTNDFVGGVNITYSDDTTNDNEFRQLLNFNLDSRGSLEKRQGFGANTGLTELLFGEINGQSAPEFPMFNQNGENNQTIENVVFFKFLTNTNNTWYVIGESESLSRFQLEFEDNVVEEEIKILIIVQNKNGTNNYYINDYKITKSSVVRTGTKGVIDVDFVVYKNLMSVPYGEDSNRLYLTSNKQGLLMFDKNTDTFLYTRRKSPGTNNAYKPNAIEVRSVGFNVLGDDPLRWVENSTLTTESIQGIYITTLENIPVMSLPTTNKFRLNILYTGTKTDFTIKFKDVERKQDEEELTIAATKNTSLSSTGLAVYDIEMKTQTNNTVEISIKFTDSSVTITPYRDYYTIGVLSPTARPVEALNVGEMRTEPIDQRLVYYGNSTLWFSEINRYDYVPNYNYVPLDIDSTDTITRIVFYKNNFIVFSRNKIFKISGTFGADDFMVSLVSDEIGCIAPNSPVTLTSELYFVSQVGLKSLKYDVFRTNLENIKDIDEKIRPFISQNEYSYGIMYKNQYVLSQNFRGEDKSITVRYQNFQIPDVCRYYEDIKAYTFDTYGVNDEGKPIYPYFLMKNNGTLYTFMETEDGLPALYKYDDGYSDFGRPYKSIVETSGINTQYPLHIKKFKNVILKASGGEIGQPLYVKVMGDGSTYHDTWVGAVSINNQGEVLYDIVEEPTTNLPASVGVLSAMELGNAKLGYSPITLRKLKLPITCKNIAISIESRTMDKLSIMSIGYTFKLGKVKE